MKQTNLSLAALFGFWGISGCASIPRYPTNKEWARTPIFKSDVKTLNVQGDFKNKVSEFLLAAAKLKDGLMKEEIKELGFNPDLKNNPCEDIGWMEASELARGGTEINADSIETAMKNRKAYSAIRCLAKDVKIRTDRMFAYINHQDTFRKGTNLSLTIILKNNLVAGVDLNKKPIKSHERESAFMKILGNIINPPKIDVDLKKLIPK